MGEREFDYYAFISYCRADEKWARWIQHKLETYRFPIALRKENQNLPRKISPVFRDKTDLSSGVLWEQLKAQLEESEYLIVICSPRSAGAKWVRKEITYFQEIGRNKNIIPLIVDGEPHADNSEMECYNTALMNQPDDELLGVSVSEFGRHKAALRVIAFMMHIRYDQLVMRDARRTRRNKIIAAGLLTAVLALIAGIIWYEIPHSAYYWSYVYRNEIPVGLVEVSRADRKTAHDYYRIVRRQNRVIRLEHINSMGTVIEGTNKFDIDEYPVIEFFYRDNNDIDYATCKDIYGNVKLIKNYTYDLNAVDFQNLNNDTAISAFASNPEFNTTNYFSDSVTSGKSGITRKLLEYDEYGYLIKELYMRNNNNTPACSENGIYGKKYVRNEDGTIRRVFNLGSDGQPFQTQPEEQGMHLAYAEYEYDSYGRTVRSSVYNTDGQSALDTKNVFCWEYIYNDSGSVEQICCLDVEGNLTINLNGIAQYNLEYNEKGFLEAEYGLNKDGAAAYDKEEGYFRVEYHKDADGRNIGLSYYDAGNKLMIGREGYASCSCKFDAQGRVIEQWFYGLEGELIRTSEGLNEAGRTNEYYDENNTAKVTYYDTNGSIELNKNGYAFLLQEYNEKGMTEKESYYDVDGEPVRSALCNSAAIVYDYDNAAHLTSISYFDETGMPCNNRDGVAKIEYGYDEFGHQTSERYFDTEGNPCYIHYEGGNYFKKIIEYNDYGWRTQILHLDADDVLLYVDGAYQKQMEYDEWGNCVRISYYDHNGNLMNNPDGYAVKELRYNARGQVISESFEDKSGQLVKGQICKYINEYDQRGNLLSSVSYVSIIERFGKWRMRIGNTTHTHIAAYYEYDERDNLIRKFFKDETDTTCEDEDGVAVYEYTFDELDRVITEAHYNQSGELSYMTDIDYDEYGHTSEIRSYTVTEQGDSQVRSLLECYTYSYDDFGNQTEERHYDKNGEIIVDSDGIAYMERNYDVMGNCIREVSIDGSGHMKHGTSGYAVEEMSYDAAGRLIRCDYYDDNGMPMAQGSGIPASLIQKWNDSGYLEEVIFYDEEGNYFGQADGISRTVYQYSSDGDNTVRLLYDVHNELVSTLVKAICIDEVEEGSQADLMGMQKYDTILKYNDWLFFGDESYLDKYIDELARAIQSDLIGTQNYDTISDYNDWSFFGDESFFDPNFDELERTMVSSDQKNLTISVYRTDFDSKDVYFQMYTFGTGTRGFTVSDTWLDFEDIKNMPEQYEQWVEEKEREKIAQEMEELMQELNELNEGIQTQIQESSIKLS